MRETEEGRKEKEKRVGGPSFEDHVTKKRRALGTRKGGEPHQNSFTEQVFEDAVKGLGYGKMEKGKLRLRPEDGWKNFSALLPLAGLQAASCKNIGLNIGKMVK